MILCPYCNIELTNGRCSHCKTDFSDKIKCAEDGSLPQEQLDQQDFVDNEIYALIKKFMPEFEWDISQISTVRASLTEVCVKHGIKEYDFYPWLLEDENLCDEVERRGSVELSGITVYYDVELDEEHYTITEMWDANLGTTQFDLTGEETEIPNEVALKVYDLLATYKAQQRCS